MKKSTGYKISDQKSRTAHHFLPSRLLSLGSFACPQSTHISLRTRFLVFDFPIVSGESIEMCRPYGQLDFSSRLGGRMER